MRTYHAEGFGSEKKMAKMFENEARRLAKDGYVPSQTTSQNAKPASMLMGGLGMIKGGYLTVTYVLSAEVKAAENAEQAAYEAYQRDEPRLMAEWKAAVAAWEEECRRIDREHAQEKALAGSSPTWPRDGSAPTVDAPHAQVSAEPATRVIAAEVAAPPAPATEATTPPPAAEQSEQVAAAERTALGTAPVGDVVERLKALSELRAAGIVSDDEYEAKRVELLARL